MDLIDPDYTLMAATLAAFCLTCAAVWWFVRTLIRSALAPRRDRSVQVRAQERLLALEERIEALGEETARLSEAQRFQGDLLATRARSRSDRR